MRTEGDNKMKKFLLTITMIITLLALTACGSSEAESGNGGGYKTGDKELDAALAAMDNYDPTSFVELGQYKGVEVNVSVSQEEIDSEIMTLLGQNTTTEEITEGTVKDGDTVNIDFVGSFDGVAFEGGTAEGANLEIGSNSFIDGFEEGLIGLNVGDKTTLDLRFPDEYPNNPDYAGKECQFEVTINYICGKTNVPEYNDEFVSTLTDNEYTSADEYTEQVIKAGIIENKRATIGDTAFNIVLNTSKVTETPDYLVTLMKLRLDASYKSMAEANGYSDFDAFLEEAWQKTPEEYDSELNQTAVSYVEQKLIAEAIAVKEGIEVTEEEYNTQLDDYMKNSEIKSVEELEKYMVETYKSRLEDLMNESIIMQKVVELVKDNAVEVDTPVEDDTDTDADTKEE